MRKKVKKKFLAWQHRLNALNATKRPAAPWQPNKKGWRYHEGQHIPKRVVT